MIPFVDLNRQYNEIKNEVQSKIGEVLASKAFVQGKHANLFEKEYAKAHKLPYFFGCSSGSCALLIAATALGLSEGDEVITTPHTFIATAEPIYHLKAKPVFADIDPVTYNIDPAKIEKAITKKTKAILPVHLYGNPADMDAIMEIAREHNLLVLEDCAHAHFAVYKDRYVGTFGDISAFSFNPGKNMGAYGDAGGVASTREDLIKRAQKIFDHGRLDNYLHDMIGYNFRLDGIQGAVLSVKLKYIPEWTKKRVENAELYNNLFKDHTNIITPRAMEGCGHVYHLYVIQVKNRDLVIKHLKDKGIDVRNHYPVPLHLQPAFNYLGYGKGDFPVTEEVANRVVSLPIFPELTGDEISFIANEVISVAE
ncbi:MAG: DegT/DnrJ/EryC1/StrS family aminotransferase [Spirochaetota bacterium]